MLDDQGASQRRGSDGRTPTARLGGAAVQWLHQLPQRVQPLQTAARFPHIANALAGAWQRPRECRAYFEQLLIDRRGDRQGFPRAIASELAALKDYYDSVVHPTQQTVWDEIVNQIRG